MGEGFFSDVTGPIPFGGLNSDDPLSFKVYEPDRLVLGKRMVSIFAPVSASGTRSRGRGSTCSGSARWTGHGCRGSASSYPMAEAQTKMAVAFEFFSKIGLPYYCFHDRDVAPEGDTFATFRSNLDVDEAEQHKEETGVRLLWGTANLFTHPRFQAGAATNPNPEVFAYAAAQVKHMLEVTLRLGGENYVLWGGREGYDTLLNTDLLAREGAQLARFLHLVAEHKHRVRVRAATFIEPKPMEPTKHQYDYDVSTVLGFLVRHGLENEYGVNIEANHATLAGHSFHHEVASAIGGRSSAASTPTVATRRTAGTPTSSRTPSTTSSCRCTVTATRGASRRAGSTSTRSSVGRARIGTTCSTRTSARSTPSRRPCWWPPTWSNAVSSPKFFKAQRYAGWDGALGAAILDGTETLETLERKVAAGRSTETPSPDSRSDSRTSSTGRPGRPTPHG